LKDVFTVGYGSYDDLKRANGISSQHIADTVLNMIHE
jgi:hypothetical protein